ncbi:MAG TPA: penicillin-binding protein 2 [Anaerolineae bacterium]|nr:penicillin-binding protein 2 [Anaerolineae bacterium]
MKVIRSALLFSLLMLTACTSRLPDDTPAGAPPQQLAPATLPLPTPNPDIHASETLGRAFLSAWEEADYAQMYALLAPSLRAGLAQSDFEQAYRTPFISTTGVSVTTVPKMLELDGAQAGIDFTVTWHTALFGNLQSDNRLDLVKENAQWWVNWRKDTIWPGLGDDLAFAAEYQIPPRANIYAKNDAGLAVPVTLVTVGVVPNQITDEPAVLTALAQVLGMTPETVQASYAQQPSHWYIPIGEITNEESLANEALLTLPGIARRDRVGRLYPLDGVGAHVVGWISSIPAEQYTDYRQRGYRGDEAVGISGLEAWGEAILAGRNGGRLYLVNAAGEYVRGLAERKPERGRAIHATLDRDLQYAAEQALGGRRGAVVALDVHTGAILALVSGPHFDSNIFVRPTDELQRQYLLNDPNHPLINRATQGQYPIGSVFKIITLAAALEAGGMTATSPFYCPGYWDGLGVPNRKLCWAKDGHGAINLKDSLTASCNVTFYEIGRLLDNKDAELLPTYGRSFGFGEKTGLQELSEAAGLIPTPAWKKATYQIGWGTGDAVNLAIGQGYLLATPLQVARAVAAVANGGVLYRPYLIERIDGNQEIPEHITSPMSVGQLPISQENLRTIQEAMLGVTTAPLGTAHHRFAGLNILVAGKTGTAEPANENDLPHSWFAGYYPAEAPEVAMAIVVENAGEGSTVAAPMFRQVLEIYYGLPVTPLPDPSTVTEGD